MNYLSFKYLSIGPIQFTSIKWIAFIRLESISVITVIVYTFTNKQGKQGPNKAAFWI